MSNYPTAYDDDVSLPIVNNNLTEIGDEAINAVRDATFNLEQEIGLGASGTAGSIADRIGVSLLPDGTINPSAIASLGLVTLPITNSQIIDNANIPESKLTLDYRTADLFNYIRDAVTDISSALNWMTITGIKLDPHLFGAIYRHDLSQIDINTYLTNRYGTFRDNTNAYQLLADINTELLSHQFADSYPVTVNTITTNDGSSYSANYAHPASGIFINTSRFSAIPETKTDLQQLAQYIDDSGIFLAGARQNLYSNGISKASRSTKLSSQTLGPSIVPQTPVITYLLGSSGISSSPVDDINYGDDIIQFKPDSSVTSTFTFDTQFAAVKPGDIIRVTYGTYNGHSAVEVPFVIKEKKFIAGSPGTYIVRIAGKNLFYSPDGYATAQIDKSLFNLNKYGVLACGAVNHSLGSSVMPSMIVGNPRNAMALGLGFNPALLNNSHYNLYLALYPTGHPSDGYIRLPAIDVTGDMGAKPGSYTLESVIETINNKFRQPGYNYRFMAFAYQGEIGIMMTDSYNNASFSIISGIVDSVGDYNESATTIELPNNIVGLFATSPLVPNDPFGFGAYGSAIASPLYQNTYSSTATAQVVTKIFAPLIKNNYYVNGIEEDTLAIEDQTLDGYGDGYWAAEITNISYTAGVRKSITYQIANLDLSSTGLKAGKTLVVQSLGGSGTYKDFGRFIIESVEFGCGTSSYTNITVYDGVHAANISDTTSAVGTRVAIYFNADSVSFNLEQSSDYTSVASTFKRHFEIFVDENGNTFTNERARISTNGSNITVNGVTVRTSSLLGNLDIVRVSPKLRGYVEGSVTKISLRMLTFTAAGDFDGYLVSYDGSTYTKYGQLVSGRKGEVTRFYDESNIDYIDIIFDANTLLSLPLASPELIDFQLFPTLSLDDEVMLIATCQHNTSTNIINYVRDERQFGNIGEKEFSTSALSFMSLPDKMMHQNGVLRGFDIQTVPIGTNPNDNQIYLQGGSALVGGKVIYKNAETVCIPKVQEYDSGVRNITWALCVNDKSEYQSIPLLDDYSDRVFMVINPVNAQTYYVDASFFSDIINNRKDLTVLYIVNSAVTVAGGIASATLTIKDVRKYALDIEANVPLRYNSNQSNFRDSVSSVFNWLYYNSSFNGNAVIRGSNTISEAIILPSSIATGNIVIDGENDASLTFTGVVTLGSNITFKNINLTFTNNIIITASTSNLRFENCNITITYTPTTYTFDFATATNIVFDNCSITVAYTALSEKILFGFNNSNNIKFINTSITGNFAGFIKLYGTFSKLLIDNCIVTSTYNPLGNGVYDATDFVNSGYGYIQGSTSTIWENIEIVKTTFNYSSNTASSDRYSFVNFELSAYNSKIDNLLIDRCIFNNTNQDATTEDIRNAISVINKMHGTYSNLDYPILQNAYITHNSCNSSQSIIITSETYTTWTTSMSNPGLMAINCHISHNSCGTIGYWIDSGLQYENYLRTSNPSNYNIYQADLTISKNNCKYISIQGSDGKYFLLTKSSGGVSYDLCEYASGNVLIDDNTTCWIHVGKNYPNSKLLITNNKLSAYNNTYLAAFGDSYAALGSSSDGARLGAGFAIFVNSNIYDSSDVTQNDDNCIISNNLIDKGIWNVTTTPTTYYYQYGGIFCKPSNIITKNIIKGITASVSNTNMICISGMSNIITHNKLYREGKDINKYIIFSNQNSPTWTGDNSSGIITDNYFDSPYRTGTTTSIISVPSSSLPSQWIVERNINQTVTRKLRLMSARHLAADATDVPNIWTLPSALSLTIPSDYTYCTLSSSGSSARHYTILFDLTHIIPKNVTLTKISAEVSCNAHTAISGIYGRLLIKNSIDSKELYEDYTFNTAGETYTFSLNSATEPLFVEYINDINGYLLASLKITISTTGSPVTTVTINELEIDYRW